MRPNFKSSEIFRQLLAWIEERDRSDCWQWPWTLNRAGYGVTKRHGLNILAHRLSYELATGTAPIQCVLHHCDNRACVNPDHLWEGSQIDNIADMDRKGRRGQLVGERCHQAKLTEPQVRVICSQLSAGHTMSDIARRFGVQPSCISGIKHGRSWNHVTGLPPLRKTSR